jgi:hypothetical protein
MRSSPYGSPLASRLRRRDAAGAVLLDRGHVGVGAQPLELALGERGGEAVEYRVVDVVGARRRAVRVLADRGQARP